MIISEAKSAEKKVINADIGARIAELRLSRSLTQEKLADLLDVSIQYVSRLERGLVGMSTMTLVQLSEILQVPADYILFGERDACTSSIMEQLRKLTPDQIDIVERAITITMEALKIK